MPNLKQTLKKTASIALLAIVCLLFGYGLLLTILGSIQQHELSDAKIHLQAIEVEITELEHAAGNRTTLIVAMQPVGNRPANPRSLGKTIATTTNRKLAVGDRLTMYYKPDNPQDRIIDFGTAAPMQHLGIILTASAVLGIVTVLLIHRIRRSRIKPTAVTG